MAALRLLIIVTAVIVAGCAPAARPQGPPSLSAGWPPATLYLFHQSGSGSYSIALWDNGENVADVQPQKYTRLSIPPGRHHVSSQQSEWHEIKGEAVDINVQPQTTYYMMISTPSSGQAFGQQVVGSLVHGLVFGPVGLLGRKVIYPAKSVSAEEAQPLMKEMALQEKPLAG